MQPTPSVNDSNGTSDSLFDLNLPTVAAGEGPLPQENPSYELMQAHARFLLRAGALKGGTNQKPNPEPFVMD
jgi:hypothetical protein